MATKGILRDFIKVPLTERPPPKSPGPFLNATADNSCIVYPPETPHTVPQLSPHVKISIGGAGACGREKKPEIDLWRRRSRCNAEIAPRWLELQGSKYPEILLTLLLLLYYTRHPPIARGRWKWRFGLPADPHHVMFVVKVNLKTT
ncbi:hypothetical protein NA56DRAFT_709177 [Hyaloscypha hepaticicola]|uniref:Uncharacterized protein n=1 Tax=Hyaloscypha hepaticicola TaxID=2082293 RepID=A0A2J6PQA1_9HELO|nr:hypothetical protein NA56DRAFT_709177 [Hyaloscypha hepaticicola]